MPAQVPVWLGNKLILETPDSPRYSHDATRMRVTRIYEGPYDVCASNQPLQSSAFVDFPPAVLVVDVKLIKKPGGIGRIEVTAETQGPSDTNPAQPTYEVEWVEVDRPLIMHPRYWDGSTSDTTPAGARPLALLDKSMLEKWEQEDDPNLKSHFIYKVVVDPNNSGTSGALAPITSYTAPDGTVFSSPTSIAGNNYNLFLLSTQAQDYAGKRLKGIESYRLWAPVARQTIETTTLPDVNSCGVIENPPSELGAPSGYSYQRSAQRATKTGRYGKWQQQQEWQGAESIDTDLYPSF
jgi:hypothetical protein